MAKASGDSGSIRRFDASGEQEHFTAIVQSHIYWIYVMARRQLGDPGWHRMPYRRYL